MIFICIRYDLHLLYFRTSDMKWQKTYIVTPPKPFFHIQFLEIYMVQHLFCEVQVVIYFLLSDEDFAVSLYSEIVLALKSQLISV